MSYISREIGRSYESGAAVERQLSEIQRSLSTANNAIRFQSDAVCHILRSVSTNGGSNLIPGRKPPLLLWNASGGYLGPLMDILDASNRDQTQRHERTQRGRIEELREGGSQIEIDTGERLAEIPKPAGLFELSQTFFPELYTSEDSSTRLRLLAYSAYEENCTERSRANCYRIFFLERPRQWRRLSLSVTITRQSVYWSYTKLSSSARASGAVKCECLPHSLHKQVEDFISDLDTLQDDTHLSVCLPDTAASAPGVVHKIQVSPGQSHSTIAAEEMLRLFDDLGCPKYLENEIIPITMLRGPNIFAT